MGTVRDEKGDDLASHVWVEAEGFIVDITADNFGQPAVIVEHDFDWHSALGDIKPFIARQDLPEGIDPTNLNRLRELYADVVTQLGEFQ